MSSSGVQPIHFEIKELHEALPYKEGGSIDRWFGDEESIPSPYVLEKHWVESECFVFEMGARFHFDINQRIISILDVRAAGRVHDVLPLLDELYKIIREQFDCVI